MPKLRHTVAAVTLVATALAAHAGYNIWTGEYTFTREELQQALDKRFPTTLQYAQIVSVQLSHPRLTLDEATNRVTTQVDAQVSNALMPTPPVNGRLALNSGIRYDPSRRAVLLDNPTVQDVQVQGVDAQTSQQLNAIGAVVARELLRDYPIHTFGPDELRVGGKEVVPGAITVAGDGIRVQVDTK